MGCILVYNYCAWRLLSVGWPGVRPFLGRQLDVPQFQFNKCKPSGLFCLAYREFAANGFGASLCDGLQSQCELPGAPFKTFTFGVCEAGFRPGNRLLDAVQAVKAQPGKGFAQFMQYGVAAVGRNATACAFGVL